MTISASRKDPSLLASGWSPRDAIPDLGRLEVWDGDDAVALGGPKPRALLALLLLHANEVVSTDRLIDELWRDDPPENAAAALQVNLSRVRKALPGDVVATRPPGYMLRVEPHALDLDRFERLVEAGRTLLERGAPGAASDRLRSALSLWRGPPLSDFTYASFAQAAIARLEEVRLLALELRIEADLARGRHDDLIGELNALIVEHPLRERLRRQLMVALYRAGRQVEALGVYKDARKRSSTSSRSNPARRSGSSSARSSARTRRSTSRSPCRPALVKPPSGRSWSPSQTSRAPAPCCGWPNRWPEIRVGW